MVNAVLYEGRYIIYIFRDFDHLSLAYELNELVLLYFHFIFKIVTPRAR